MQINQGSDYVLPDSTAGSREWSFCLSTIILGGALCFLLYTLSHPFCGSTPNHQLHVDCTASPEAQARLRPKHCNCQLGISTPMSHRCLTDSKLTFISTLFLHFLAQQMTCYPQRHYLFPPLMTVLHIQIVTKFYRLYFLNVIGMHPPFPIPKAILSPPAFLIWICAVIS